MANNNPKTGMAKVARQRLNGLKFCNFCGEKKRSELTLDHIIPRCMGGSKIDINNLQILCKSCHDQKSHVEQAAMAESPAGLYKVFDKLVLV